MYLFEQPSLAIEYNVDCLSFTLVKVWLMGDAAYPSKKHE